MKFYPGLHQPSDARHFRRAFISVNRLRNRRSDFVPPAEGWIMDSGAFTTLETHGEYPESVHEYAEQIERWRHLGMVAAVAQDYMCEPFMLERTGGTVLKHQGMTINRYVALHNLAGDIVMPVLQGYAPQDYAGHRYMYGELIQPGDYVGVGSVCKRQGRPSAIAAVLDAIGPGLRLHLFGVKESSLRDGSVRDRAYSCDSMAWSFAARKQGRNGNDWREARAFCERIESQPVQTSWL